MSEDEVLTLFYDAGLKPGINWRRELIELINEIAVRENISTHKVLESSQVKDTLSHIKLSSPQKLEKIKEILFQRRYPLVTVARKVFSEQLKSLNISSEIKVSTDPFFEKEDLKIELKTKTTTNFEEIEASLKKIKGAKLIKNALKAAEDNC